MGKKANLNHARNMDIDAWRERQVCKRLKARLASQTQDFTDRHGTKTDEQLRELVLRRAKAMGRMPVWKRKASLAETQNPESAGYHFKPTG